MNVLAYQSCKDSLDFDIWHYMKRCILAFLEELGKGTLPQLEASTAVDLLAAFLQVQQQSGLNSFCELIRRRF